MKFDELCQLTKNALIVRMPDMREWSSADIQKYVDSIVDSASIIQYHNKGFTLEQSIEAAMALDYSYRKWGR